MLTENRERDIIVLSRESKGERGMKDLFNECAYVTSGKNFSKLSKEDQAEKEQEELESIHGTVANAIESAIEETYSNLSTIDANDKQEAVRAILDKIIDLSERELKL